MRVVIAVGTRPEIIKMAPVYRAAVARGHETMLLHTGQHYSDSMSGLFFKELDLPVPDTDLGVGSASHPSQIAAVLTAIEPVLAAWDPDSVLVEGDTNSVLGVALAARTMGFPVGHVEAGLRSGDLTMPEELNRTLVDHMAADLFAPTSRAVANLSSEGIDAGVVMTGNPIVDELERQRPAAHAASSPARFGLEPRRYALATVHRAENTERPDRLRGIFSGLAAVADANAMPILVALHPRTADRLERHGIAPQSSIRIVPPLGYHDFLGLMDAAALILTDSGGVQEEACVLGVPCVTLRDNTERPETIEVGANILAGADPHAIAAAATRMIDRDRAWVQPFGDGQAGQRIVEALSSRD
jgi:UDP-N-acetylglucosamine 2-epimerase (non-hydrolysing)